MMFWSGLGNLLLECECEDKISNISLPCMLLSFTCKINALIGYYPSAGGIRLPMKTRDSGKDTEIWVPFLGRLV